MAIPATGTTWKAGGFNDVDNRFLERGGLIAALVRDARGSATNITPTDENGTVLWSPFAEDGQLRDDLFAFKKVDGFWVTNPEANEGFHLVGAFKEGDGPKKKGSLDTDDYMIEQSNSPFDSIITKEEETFSFTAVETLKPAWKRLRNNLRLNDANGVSLCEDPGLQNAVWVKPLEADFVDRQVLLLRARKVGGKFIYTCTGYACARLSDVGDAQMGKKDADAAELTFKAIPDGFLMGLVDGEYGPAIKAEWAGGDGWSALGGVPVLSATAPVATAGTTGKATIVFADPTGTGDPWTITAESTVDDGTTWLPAVLDTPGAVTSTGGSTTVKVKSVTAGSTKFRAKVVGTNGASAYTPKSNAVTIS